MKKQTLRAWLYLLPAILFLGFFLVYPLIDVFVYSMEEGYNFASQTYFGTGFYNYSYVLHDPYFLQAVRCRTGRFYQRSLLGEDVCPVLLHDLGRYAL